MADNDASTDRPADYPPDWPWPPVAHQEIPVPEIELVTESVMDCLRLAHEFRIWAECWPDRPERPCPIIDHVIAMVELLELLGETDPLINRCRVEFAAVNAANPVAASQTYPSSHVGAFDYAMRIPEKATEAAGTLLLHGPPHPVTGNIRMDIPGLMNVHAANFSAGIKALPEIEFSVVAASIERESALARKARGATFVTGESPTARKRTRTKLEVAEAAAKEIYGQLWRNDNAREWGRQIAEQIGQDQPVNYRTVKKLETWRVARERRARVSQIGKRLRAHRISEKFIDSLEDSTSDEWRESIDEQLDAEERKRLKNDPELRELFEQQARADSNRQFPNA